MPQITLIDDAGNEYKYTVSKVSLQQNTDSTYSITATTQTNASSNIYTSSGQMTTTASTNAGTFVSPNTAISPYPPATFGWDVERLNPCLGGHRASKDLVEYVDGVYVAACINCKARFLLHSVPGGVSLLRIKTLLGSVMGLEVSEGPDLSALLGMYAELCDELEEHELALEEARKLLKMATELINSKLRDEPDLNI